MRIFEREEKPDAVGTQKYAQNLFGARENIFELYVDEIYILECQVLINILGYVLLKMYIKEFLCL